MAAISFLRLWRDGRRRTRALVSAAAGLAMLGTLLGPGQPAQAQVPDVRGGT